MALEERKFNNITMIFENCMFHMPRFNQCTSQNVSGSDAITGLAI
jgi:hypothetical protein